MPCSECLVATRIIASGKIIYALSNDSEICRDDFLRTPRRPIRIVIVHTIAFPSINFSRLTELNTHISFCIDHKSHWLNIPGIKLLPFSSAQISPSKAICIT